MKELARKKKEEIMSKYKNKRNEIITHSKKDED